MLGIHWRVSDNMHGMFMGEKVAISLLNELGATYPEKFPGFTLTKFDGTTIWSAETSEQKQQQAGKGQR